MTPTPNYSIERARQISRRAQELQDLIAKSSPEKPSDPGNDPARVERHRRLVGAARAVSNEIAYFLAALLREEDERHGLR